MATLTLINYMNGDLPTAHGDMSNNLIFIVNNILEVEQTIL